MTSRERVQAALTYRPVDKAPLQYYYTPVGYYEHGEKLNQLYARLPGDFQPHAHQPIPVLPPEDFDGEGRYHAFRRDEWGTLWEFRIFGIAGIPCEYPLADMNRLDSYPLPPTPRWSEDEIAAIRQKWQEHQQSHYLLHGVGSLIERLKALRGDADTLCDIALDTPEINALADRILEHDRAQVDLAVAAGADGISFGDDYGMEHTMLLSPALWRRFFKPRLRELFRPAVAAGLDVVFHSCGMVAPILEDLREVGATAIWPQLPAYDMRELAERCRALGLAVAIHTDRANTMTFGTPQQVRELVQREFDTFRMMEGGSWFYVEADNGFPFENIEALVETIAQWR